MQSKQCFALLKWLSPRINADHLKQCMLAPLDIDLPNLIRSICEPELAKLLITESNSPRFKNWIQWFNDTGARVTYIGAPDYPATLLQLEHPPLALTYLGEPAWLTHHMLGIVGSRQPRIETIEWLEHHLPKILSQRKIAIVSGGARGVDQKAHGLSILHNRPTICFVPSGLQKLYPNTLINFQKAICRGGGALISQFAPDQLIFKSHFQNRNLLIAHMAPVLFVAEAQRQSGSMLTARFALEASTTVVTLPISPMARGGQGNLDLILHGATLLRDADDLILELNRAFPPPPIDRQLAFL